MRHRRHSCNHKRILLIIFYICSLSSISITSIAADSPDVQESHPGIGRESRYAEAVIAFNKKQTDEAVKILNELLVESPKNIEYLELKALALKGKGDEKESLKLYSDLYNAKPEKERGPYAFEIASILEKQKKTQEAKPYFEKSAELGFNVAASNLYIGLGAFNSALYAEAETFFNKITSCGIPEIELVAQYYISLCYFKMNASTRGVQELIEAKDVSKKVLNSDSKNVNAKNIFDASEKMLAPFSIGQWFGNAALMTQYDSNIQQLPAGSINTTATDNASTMKANFLAGIGYMSAPINTFQLVSGYRASYNKNFNSLTKGFEYFTNNASINLNYRALAKTTYSLKIDSNLVFQNSLIDPTNSKSGYENQKYNFTFGGGLAARHQLDRYWRAEAELNLHRQLYYADSNQSGQNSNINVSVRRTGGDSYFNPGISALFENNKANGNLNYYNAYGLGLSNFMTLSSTLTLNEGIDFLFTNYTKTLPLRTDANYSFKVGVIKNLPSKISLMADLNYIKNFSSIQDSYTYNRILASIGVGYNF